MALGTSSADSAALAKVTSSPKRFLTVSTAHRGVQPSYGTAAASSMSEPSSPGPTTPKSAENTPGGSMRMQVVVGGFVPDYNIIPAAPLSTDVSASNSADSSRLSSGVSSNSNSGSGGSVSKLSPAESQRLQGGAGVLLPPATGSRSAFSSAAAAAVAAPSILGPSEAGVNQAITALLAGVVAGQSSLSATEPLPRPSSAPAAAPAPASATAPLPNTKHQQQGDMNEALGALAASVAASVGSADSTSATTSLLLGSATQRSDSAAQNQSETGSREDGKDIKSDVKAVARKFAEAKINELLELAKHQQEGCERNVPKPLIKAMERDEKKAAPTSTASSSASPSSAGAPSAAASMAAAPAPAAKADTKNIFDDKGPLKDLFTAETLAALKDALKQLDDDTILQLIGAVKPDRLEQLRIAAFTTEQLKDAEANLAKFGADRKAANIKDDVAGPSFPQLLKTYEEPVALLKQAKALLEGMTPTERGILEREKTEGLEPRHDFKHVRDFNLKAAPFTALGMFLYLATTGGDSTWVTASTTFSNLLQNQYFLYKVWTKLSRTGLGDEAKSTLAFGALATLPYIMATAYTATPLDSIPVWAQAAGQGIGFGPLNMYARENCKAAKSSLEQFVADVRRKEPQAVELEKICAATVTETRKHFVKSFRAYLETLKAEEALDKLDIKRDYSLPEQLDKLLKQSGFTAPVPQEDSLWYKAALGLFGLAGGVFLLWSSLGYGGLTGYVLAGLLGKCGVPTGAALTALTQGMGHIVTSPLYALSCDAGISTGQAIPKIFCGGLLQKFIDNPHYRRYAAPDLITLPIATFISSLSYGSSLDLMQYVEPRSFFGGDVSSFVAKWFTVAFNSQYSHLPMASGVRLLARKFSTPLQAERMNKYDQLQERLKQLENMTDEGFMEMCQRLYKKDEVTENPTMTAMLGDKHIELLRAMMLSGLFRDIKQQAAELAAAEKAKLSASTQAATAGGGFYASNSSSANGNNGGVHQPLLSRQAISVPVYAALTPT